MASERMKVLAEQPIKNMFVLYEAIPQVIAVLEAAEERRNDLEGQHPFDDWEKFDLALSALEEVLS